MVCRPAKHPGRTYILNDQQRARLAEIVETGPIPAANGVVRWRLADLARRVWYEFEVSVRRHAREGALPTGMLFWSDRQRSQNLPQDRLRRCRDLCSMMPCICGLTS
jgi:hypothetical protein